jgi:hypothetical protein
MCRAVGSANLERWRLRQRRVGTDVDGRDPMYLSPMDLSGDRIEGLGRGLWGTHLAEGPSEDIDDIANVERRKDEPLAREDEIPADSSEGARPQTRDDTMDLTLTGSEFDRYCTCSASSDKVS